MNDSVQSTEPRATSPLSRYYVRVAPPRLTRILIGINLCVFIAMFVVGVWYFEYDGGSILGRTAAFTSDVIALLLGNKYPETELTLLIFGAKFNPLIQDGQIWRLLTAVFLHIGIIHLLFNLFALNVLGPMVEGYFGHVRFAAIYFMSGIFGSLASYAFSGALSAGASGAIFGLAGATIVYFVRYRNNFGDRGQSTLQSMLAFTVINFIFGLSVNGIDNWGHFGGLVGGILTAWGLLPRYASPAATALLTAEPQQLPEENRSLQEIAWTVLIVAIFWIALQYANQITPI